MLFKKSVRIYDTVFRRINYYTPKGERVRCFGCKEFLNAVNDKKCKWSDICSYQIKGNYGECDEDRYYKYVL